MADLDFSDLGATEVKPLDFSDLGGVEVSEPEAPKEISKLDSALAGVKQGGSLNTADELTGVVDAGLDAGQQLLNKLGLTEPSPTQVNESLAQQGVTGDLGPQGILDAYRAARDKERSLDKAAMEANPKSYMGGAVAGGLATIPLLPAGAPVAKGASMAQKMLSGAQQGAQAGAIFGLGAGESDLTKGDVAGAIDDVAKGTAMGTLGGAALPPIISGAKALSNKLPDMQDVSKMIPDPVKDAFQRGKQGVDIGSDDFYKKTNEKSMQIVDDVASPILEKVDDQKSANKLVVDTLQQKIADAKNKTAELVKAGKVREAQLNNEQSLALESELQAAKAAQKSQVNSGKNIQEQENAQKVIEVDNKLAKAKAVAQEIEMNKQAQAAAATKEQVKETNSKAVELGKKIQSRVKTVKDTIGKQFKQIDDAAEAAGVIPENRDIIGMMDEAFTAVAGNEKQKNILMKKYANLLGKKDMTSFRDLKALLYADRSSQDRVIRDTAKAAYDKLKDNYEQQLLSSNRPELAKKLSETNRKWMEALDVEDQFLNDVSLDRLTGDQALESATTRTIKAFGGDDLPAISRADDFTQKFNMLDPEGAPGLIQEIQANRQALNTIKNPAPVMPEVNPEVARLQSLVQEAKGASAAVPELPNPAITQMENKVAQQNAMPKVELPPELPNPKLAQLEQMLAQAKGQTPQQIPGLDISTASPQALKDELLRLLPKKGMRSSDVVSEKRLQQLESVLRKEKGDEFVDKLFSEIPELNKDIRLRDLQNKPQTGEVEASTTGLAKAALGKSTGIANYVGRKLHSAEQKMTVGRNILKNGAKALNKSTPEEMNEVANRMEQMGSTGQTFANDIRNASDKNEISKTAIIFGLMQKKEFREMLRKVNGEDEDETK